MSDQKQTPLPNAKPKVVGNITFRAYRIGVGQIQWISDDDRCRAWWALVGIGRNNVYRAAVDDVELDARFRSLETAMKAAVRKASRTAA